MEGVAPTPDDLLSAFDRVRVRLAALAQEDWDVKVPEMDWTVRDTVEHLVDTIGFYTLHLLSESPRRLPVDLRCHRGISNASVLDVLAAEVRGLARSAALLPASTRAYHFHGMADVSGFLGLACAELLIHGDDACRGMGVTVDADGAVTRKVVERLLPWAPGGGSPWNTLLWATGRSSLEGFEDLGPDWAYHPAPLQEWNGVRSTGVVTLDGYTFEAQSRRWIAATT